MLKRNFDIVASLGALLVFSPLFLALALVIRIRLGAPVLFVQERPGLKGRPFRIYKFRSMTDVRDDEGRLLPNSERLTGLGRFLRSSSLDELPELLNVLRGEMSLVGPRPLLMEYLDRYSCEEARRHDVRPGMTGWAQVNGRNAITWEEKFALDLWYVDNRSFLLDLRILWMTIRKVFEKDGISHAGTVTMPRFRGSRKEKADE